MGAHGLMCVLPECHVVSHRATKLSNRFYVGDLEDGDQEEELVFILTASEKEVHVDPWIIASLLGDQREVILADTRDLAL